MTSNQARRGGGALAAELELRELNERGERHVGQARDADELEQLSFSDGVPTRPNLRPT